MASSLPRLPVLFVSHGAATLTMDPSTTVYRAFVDFGRRLRADLAKRHVPRITVLMISAHDVRKVATVGTVPVVRMIADHPAADGHSWSAPGNPEAAAAVLDALRRAGVEAGRGEPSLDHGAWVPLSLLFPTSSATDFPVSIVTLSLSSHMDAAEHWRLGEALAPLRSSGSGLFIVGSGGATHSQDAFRAGYFGRKPVEVPQPFSATFSSWLERAVTLPHGSSAASSAPAPAESVAAERRHALLVDAPSQPTWAECHPTPDHWLPLVVAAAAAGESHAEVAVSGFQHSLSVASFMFDD